MTRVCLERPALVRVPELDRLVLARRHAVVTIHTVSAVTQVSVSLCLNVSSFPGIIKVISKLP